LVSLDLITINETGKWDKIVKSFRDYDVNYLSAYAKAFHLHGEGDPLLLFYNDGNTRAMNVVMKRDIALAKPFRERLPSNTWFDLATPYGYGGLLIEGANYSEVNQAYDSYFRDNGFVSEFVRFHLFNGYVSHYDGLSKTFTRNVVRNLDVQLDDMWMDFEHRVRKSVKKAAKAELEVQIDYNGEKIEDFLNIYYGTMDRTNARENFYFSNDFFKTLSQLEDHYVYFHVIYDGQIISTELVLYGKENCYSFLGGTNRDYIHLNANNLLKYEIIKWAKEKGLKRFILGGGYGNDDGIFKYKKGFAPNGIYDFYVGMKVFDEDKYNHLVDIRRNEEGFNENTLFFPLYRG
jgi:hypothetical protein